MENMLLTRAKDIATHFVTQDELGSVSPFGCGRINDTFLVTTQNGGRFILQRLHPIFEASVLRDIRAITVAMAASGFTTPEIIPTRDGDIGVHKNSECWRALTFVPGRTIENGATEAEVHSGMRLIGRFHHVFSDHEYVFRHERKGFHDTDGIMHVLDTTRKEYVGTEKGDRLAGLASEILRAYKETPHAWAHLPKRIIHGDLKLSNIRFAEHCSEAVALLDLDTLGRHSIVIDIADAARSWCNRADEGDAHQSNFDVAIFRSMISGYVGEAKFLTEDERVAIPSGIAQIALELAARFVTDAYKESYFKLDAERYPNLFTQNSEKGTAQFALYHDIRKKLTILSKIASGQ